MTGSKQDRIFARNALLPHGWAQDVLLGWDRQGVLRDVGAGASAPKGVERHQIIVPGMANLHCHSFQRAMAGLTEIRGPGEDSFWTWRNWMYRFVRNIQPEDLQAIAAFAYMEMLKSGFTSVGEFHYLHHQPDGTPYDNPAEMSERILAAADSAGITPTLLPVFYAHSDFGGKAPVTAQSPFLHNVDGFIAMVDGLRARHKGTVIGIAPHSLRAVTEDELRALLAALPHGPVHIHAAEQMAEVKACKTHYGTPPVRTLLERFDVDHRWCIVHATHMDGDETRDLAQSGAVAGLCPVTEANLGDGLFPAVEYMHTNGQFGIGSDSCVRIDLADELRTLEYGQRLSRQKRTLLAAPEQSVGTNLFTRALTGGAQALGQQSGALAVGKQASFVALAADHPDLQGRSPEHWIDSWVFAARDNPVQHVWSAGLQVVTNKYHAKQQTITDSYISILKRISAA